jgi:hypothetical protein
MPYNSDGTKKKNPTKTDWKKYQNSQANALRKTPATNTGGASIGGGSAAAGGGG